MTDDLTSAFSLANLYLAWKRILTSSDAAYKDHFRHIYRAYSVQADKNLRDLRRRLIQGSYTALHATKLFRPKPSGIQRTISLLCVEDQIVYQSMINVVADRLLRQTQHRYYRLIFGNLYAGRRNAFFYRDWRQTYRRFADAVRAAYGAGYVWTASFDLTACYDSIDHTVLAHFLKRLRLSPEFCEYLTNLLSHWTAASGETPIYHGHGIPQGPQPSGMLAEVVLRHFDEVPHQGNYRYFRYVDDIRLFARKEKVLRARIVTLDIASKEVGLFPQSAKIKIHEVSDIEDELKSISHPPEHVLAPPRPDQLKVRRRLTQLSFRNRINNVTRFKYVLGRALPNAELSNRLVKLLREYPHLYFSVASYLSRTSLHPRSVSANYVGFLAEYDFYPAVTAALLRAFSQRVNPSSRAKFTSLARKFLKSPNPELRAAAGMALLVADAMTWRQTKYHVVAVQNWWVRSDLCRHLNTELIGEPSHSMLLNRLVRDSVLDVAVVAADLMIEKGLDLDRPLGGVHPGAQRVFKAAGWIGRIRVDMCAISDAMVRVLGPKVASINWRTVLGMHYNVAVSRVVRWRGYATSDATAWVNLTDTINDLIIDSLFVRQGGALGSYQLGNVGGALNRNSRFARSFPLLFGAVAAIHQRRLESALSHPYVKSSGQPTGYVEFRELKPLMKQLADGYVELWKAW